MHALPSSPRHPLLAGIVALLVALLVMAATAPDLGTLDLSIGAGGPGDAPRVEQPLTTTPHAGAPAQPTWVRDPLSAPLGALAGTR